MSKEVKNLTPEESKLWKDITVGMCLMDSTNSDTTPIDWADHVITAYRERQPSTADVYPVGSPGAKLEEELRRGEEVGYKEILRYLRDKIGDIHRDIKILRERQDGGIKILRERQDDMERQHEVKVLKEMINTLKPYLQEVLDRPKISTREGASTREEWIVPQTGTLILEHGGRRLVEKGQKLVTRKGSEGVIRIYLDGIHIGYTPSASWLQLECGPKPVQTEEIKDLEEYYVFRKSYSESGTDYEYLTSWSDREYDSEWEDDTDNALRFSNKEAKAIGSVVFRETGKTCYYKPVHTEDSPVVEDHEEPADPIDFEYTDEHCYLVLRREKPRFLISTTDHGGKEKYEWGSREKALRFTEEEAKEYHGVKGVYAVHQSLYPDQVTTGDKVLDEVFKKGIPPAEIKSLTPIRYTPKDDEGAYFLHRLSEDETVLYLADWKLGEESPTWTADSDKALAMGLHEAHAKQETLREQSLFVHLEWVPEDVPEEETPEEKVEDKVVEVGSASEVLTLRGEKGTKESTPEEKGAITDDEIPF